MGNFDARVVINTRYEDSLFEPSHDLFDVVAHKGLMSILVIVFNSYFSYTIFGLWADFLFAFREQ